VGKLQWLAKRNSQPPSERARRRRRTSSESTVEEQWKGMEQESDK